MLKTIWYMHIEEGHDQHTAGDWFVEAGGPNQVGQAYRQDDGTWMVSVDAVPFGQQGEDTQWVVQSIEEAKRQIGLFFNAEVEEVDPNDIYLPQDE